MTAATHRRNRRATTRSHRAGTRASGAWAVRLRNPQTMQWGLRGVLARQSPGQAQDWIDKFSQVERDMIAKTVPQYQLLPMPGLGNSNSWARELIERAGLKAQYECAIRKRGCAPWVPGWGSRPWD